MCHTTHSVITQNGESALMKAAYFGETEVVVELVKSGANLDLQDNVCDSNIILGVVMYMYIGPTWQCMWSIH